jgi:hypothetical protein
MPHAQGSLSRRAQNSLQFGRVLVRNRGSQDFAAIPFSSFSTLSLSGDGLLTSTKRADPPGISVPANSFMNRSVIPTSASGLDAAPVVAFRKIREVSAPQKPAKTTSSEVRRLPAWRSLTLPLWSLMASITSSRCSRYSPWSSCSFDKPLLLCGEISSPSVSFGSFSTQHVALG